MANKPKAAAKSSGTALDDSPLTELDKLTGMKGRDMYYDSYYGTYVPYNSRRNIPPVGTLPAAAQHEDDGLYHPDSDQPIAITVSLLAGLDLGVGAGVRDGPAATATFMNPVCCAYSGVERHSVFVTDTNANRVREIRLERLPISAQAEIGSGSGGAAVTSRRRPITPPIALTVQTVFGAPTSEDTRLVDMSEQLTLSKPLGVAVLPLIPDVAAEYKFANAMASATGAQPIAIPDQKQQPNKKPFDCFAVVSDSKNRCVRLIGGNGVYPEPDKPIELYPTYPPAPLSRATSGAGLTEADGGAAGTAPVLLTRTSSNTSTDIKTTPALDRVPSASGSGGDTVTATTTNASVPAQVSVERSGIIATCAVSCRMPFGIVVEPQRTKQRIRNSYSAYYADAEGGVIKSVQLQWKLKYPPTAPAQPTVKSSSDQKSGAATGGGGAASLSGADAFRNALAEAVEDGSSAYFVEKSEIAQNQNQSQTNSSGYTGGWSSSYEYTGQDSTPRSLAAAAKAEPFAGEWAYASRIVAGQMDWGWSVGYRSNQATATAAGAYDQSVVDAARLKAYQAHGSGAYGGGRAPEPEPFQDGPALAQRIAPRYLCADPRSARENLPARLYMSVPGGLRFLELASALTSREYGALFTSEGWGGYESGLPPELFQIVVQYIELANSDWLFDIPLTVPTVSWIDAKNDNKKLQYPQPDGKVQPLGRFIPGGLACTDRGNVLVVDRLANTLLVVNPMNRHSTSEPTVVLTIPLGSQAVRSDYAAKLWPSEPNRLGITPGSERFIQLNAVQAVDDAAGISFDPISRSVFICDSASNRVAMVHPIPLEY